MENNEEKCEVTFEEEEKKDGCGENEAVTEEVENGDSCSQESEACGDGEPQMSENGEECEKCEDGCEEPEKEPEEDYKKKCEEYALIIESLKNEITEKENHYSSELEKYKDYEDIKKELFAEKEKVKHYFCEDLKRYAIKIMSGENLPKESYDSIIENCYSKYSCEEDIKKDVAYAVYNARPTSEKRFSVSIETEAAESKEEKTMSVQERLAARAKKYEK